MTVVKQNNIDKAFEKMNDIERGVWERIAKATCHNQVNYITWDMAEEVISKYCKMAR